MRSEYPYYHWWATKQEPPKNRQDSFKAVVKKDNRKHKQNYLKGKR